MRAGRVRVALLAAVAGALAGCVEIPFDAPPGPRSGEGSVTIEPDRVEAAEEARFRIAWTAGPSGLAPGGGFRVEFPVDPVHRYLGFAPPQGRTRFLRGHVVCAAMRGDAVLVKGIVDTRGREARCLLPGGRLREGDRLVMEYWSLAPRVAGRWPLHVESRYSGGSGGRAVAVPPVLEVTPRAARSFHAVLPGAARAGDPMTLAVVALDEFGNRARDYLGTIAVELDAARLEHQFTSEEQGVALLPGLAVESPGFHRAVITEAAGPPQMPLGATSNPVKITVDPPEPVLWGDLHFHTGDGAAGRAFLPDGGQAGDHRGNYTGLQEAYAHARDVMRLDFAAATEHAGRWLTVGAWEGVRRAASEAHDPPRFTAIEALQWEDRLVLFARAPVRLPQSPRTPLGAIAGPGDALVALRDAARGAPVDAMEIYSWRNRGSGYEDRPRAMEPDGSWPAGGEAPPASFVAGSDNHWGHPGAIDITTLEPGSGGLTAVRATANDRGAILEAIRSGRAWATTGARIHLAVERQGGALRVEAAGSAPFARIVLVVVDRNGVREVPAPTGAGLELQVSIEVPEAAHPAFCYVRAEQQDGEIAWSSPLRLGEE